MWLVLGFLVCLVAACAGSVTKASEAGGGAVGDASEMDSGEDALTCPPIPDADVYLCEAGIAGSAGCQAAIGDPMAVYPEGCVMALPHRGPVCSGLCCGPISCTCQQPPPSIEHLFEGGLNDGGLTFICGL